MCNSPCPIHKYQDTKLESSLSIDINNGKTNFPSFIKKEGKCTKVERGNV